MIREQSVKVLSQRTISGFFKHSSSNFITRIKEFIPLSLVNYLNIYNVFKLIPLTISYLLISIFISSNANAQTQDCPSIISTALTYPCNMANNQTIGVAPSGSVIVGTTGPAINVPDGINGGDLIIEAGGNIASTGDIPDDSGVINVDYQLEYIENDGTITASDSDNAIYIDESAVSSNYNGSAGIINRGIITGDIVNKGTIHADGNYAILIDGATGGGKLYGRIINDGTIQSSSPVISVVDNGLIEGGITNNAGGNIFGDTGGSTYYTNDETTKSAIYIDETSQIQGGIINKGNIKSIYSGAIRNEGILNNNAGAAILIEGNGLSYDSNLGTIAGRIINSGTISGSTHGIEISNYGQIQGGIINNAGGEITGGTGADERGIYVGENSKIEFGILNHGKIDDIEVAVGGEITSGFGAAIQIEGDGAAYDDDGNGIITEGIVNAGTITATSYGIEVTDYGQIQGGVTNNAGGRITGGSGSRARGILVDANSEIQDGIINRGYIDDIEVATDGEITNDNGAGISVEQDAGATGYSNANGVIEFGIINAGTINGSTHGIELSNYGQIQDGITNNAGGRIEGGAGDAERGIYVGANGKIEGTIINKGYIDDIEVATDGTIIGNTGAAAISVEQDAGATEYSNTNGIIEFGIINAGTINGSTRGINVSNYGQILGGIANSGTIEGLLGIFIFNNSQVQGGITNLAGGTITESDHSIYVTGNSQVYGGINNSGTLSSTLNGYAIHVTDNSQIQGGVTNNEGGSILSRLTGIKLENNGVIAGGLNNSGTISGTENDAIIITTNSRIEGGIINNAGATITGGEYGINVIDGSQILGGINNSGTISGTNKNGIRVTDTNSRIEGGIINNAGATITGGDYGINVIDGSQILGGINNSGTISGTNEYGIHITNTNSQFQGDITNSGTISGGKGGISAGRDIQGNIINTGTIEGTLYSVNTFLNNGNKIINYGSLKGEVILGHGNLELRGDNAQVDGDITGFADSEVNVYNSFTTNGNISVSKVQLHDGSELTLENNVNTTNGFFNDGNVVVNQGKVINITGDYTQEANGILSTSIDGTNYGRISVTGDIDLSDSGNFYVNIISLGNITDGHIFDNILSSTGGSLTVGDDGLAVTVNYDSLVWDFEIINDGSDGVDIVANYLTIEERNDDIELPEYAEGAADGISELLENTSSADLVELKNQIDSISNEEDYVSAMKQLTPALLDKYLTTSTIANTKQITRIVEEQVTDSTISFAPQSLNLFTNNAYTELGFNSHGIVGGNSVWVRPFYQDTERKKSGLIDGYDATTKGLVVGYDKQISDDLKLGAGLAYTDATLESKQVVGKQTSDITSFEFVAFGRWQENDDYFANFSASAGVRKNEGERKIQIGNINNTATSKHDGWFTQIKAEVGQHYKQAEDFTLSPAISLSYMHIHEDGYTEEGAGNIGLVVEDFDKNILLIGLGGDIEFKPDEMGSTIVKVSLGVDYDILHEKDTTKSSFIGGGSSFETIWYDDSPWSISGGVGINIPVKENLDFNIGYDVDARENYLNQVISTTVKLDF